jgi:hypothetical protein
MNPDEAEVQEILKERNYPSLDIAFEEAKRILDSQLSQIEALDVKASILIASSGVLLTLFLTVLPGMIRSLDSLILGGIIAAIVSVILSAIFGVIAFRLKVYENIPSIESLIGKYLTWEEPHAKYHMLFEFKRSYEHNRKEIEPKVWRVKLSLAAFEISIIVSTITLLYQLWLHV